MYISNEPGVVHRVFIGAVPVDLTGFVRLDCDEYERISFWFTEKDYIPRRKWDGVQLLERTPEEIDSDRAALPPPPPSDSERITALEQENKQLKETINSLTLGVNQAR